MELLTHVPHKYHVVYSDVTGYTVPADSLTEARQQLAEVRDRWWPVDDNGDYYPSIQAASAAGAYRGSIRSGSITINDEESYIEKCPYGDACEIGTDL